MGSVGRVGSSLWNERGEEGADEGPGGNQEAQVVKSRLALQSSLPPAVILLVLHPLIHDPLLKEGGRGQRQNERRGETRRDRERRGVKETQGEQEREREDRKMENT